MNPLVYVPGTVIRFLVLTPLFVRLLLLIIRGDIRGQKNIRLLLTTVLVYLFYMVESYIFSPLFKLSSFKILLFFSVFTSLIFLFRSLRREQIIKLQNFTLSFFSLVLIVSFPLYFSSYGFVRNTTGYQGLLNHPQTMGIFSAIYLSIAMSFGKRSNESWGIAIMSIGMFSLFAAKSRGAFLAMLIGMGVIYYKKIMGFLRSKEVSAVKKFAVITLAVLAMVYLTPYIAEFLRKSNTQSDVLGALKDSRLDIYFRMLMNIYESPFFGIGWSIPSSIENLQIEYGFLGIPIGASVEKSNSLLALAEETGLVGFLLFIVYFIYGIKGHYSFRYSLVFLVGLLVNFSDSMLWSFFGNALLIWYCVFLFGRRGEDSILV